MSGLVDGKIALVTGAASGIGAESARLFAAEGASVLAVDVDGDKLDAVVASIREGGGDAEARVVDVTDEAEVAAMVETAVERWGRLDCAHNNAGIGDRRTSLTELTLDRWQRMIAVNLTSVFLCLKHELRHMEARGSGVIVNTSSGAGIVGFAPLPHYVAAKHGVLGLTKCAAMEYTRKGIRVNAICPGTTLTGMTQVGMADPEMARLMTATVARGEIGRPDEVAQAAVWLCSDRASFVSGEAMLVDGASVCR
jgi:NAD(P)-dependent dehydrogenase (short-subunit alcohol dehydrogenase family)